LEEQHDLIRATASQNLKINVSVIETKVFSFFQLHIPVAFIRVLLLQQV